MRTKLQRWTGTVVLVVSLAALALGAWSSWRWRAFALCQAELDQKLIVALDARTDAIDQLMADVTAAKSGAEVRAALERYQATRAANPLPPSALDVCAR